MTRDEVLAMKPGWELDALIAEKVMGWKTNWLKTDWWEEINPNTHRHKGLVKDFKPSTDIAVAFEILDMFKVYEIYKYLEGVKVVVLRTGQRGVAKADSVPEAICKAALLAVMGE